jgi:hypothetical protein
MGAHLSVSINRVFGEIDVELTGGVCGFGLRVLEPSNRRLFDVMSRPAIDPHDLFMHRDHQQRMVLRDQGDRQMSRNKKVTPTTTQPKETLAEAAKRAAEGLPLDPSELVEMMQRNAKAAGEKEFEIFTYSMDWLDTYAEMIEAIEGRGAPPPQDRILALQQVLQVMRWLASTSSRALPDVIENEPTYPELRDAQAIGWIDGLTRAFLTQRHQLGLPDVPETPTPAGINMHYEDPATRKARAAQESVQKRDQEEDDDDLI